MLYTKDCRRADQRYLVARVFDNKLKGRARLWMKKEDLFYYELDEGTEHFSTNFTKKAGNPTQHEKSVALENFSFD